MTDLKSVGPHTEFEIISDKQQRTREIMQRADAMRAIPRCSDCDWRLHQECRQPLVSNYTIDARGTEQWEQVSITRARENPDLCGPNAHLFMPLSREKRSAITRQKAGKKLKSIASVLGVLAAIVGAIWLLIWMIGFKMALIGLAVLVVLAFCG